MKRWPLLMLLASIVILAGCTTLTYLTVLSDKDRLELQSHKVPNSLYEQMVLREPISFRDVAMLSKCQVSTNFIISYVDTSGARYHLTDDDIAWLRTEEVNQDLIAHLKEVHPPFATRLLQGFGSVFAWR